MRNIDTLSFVPGKFVFLTMKKFIDFEKPKMWSLNNFVFS